MGEISSNARIAKNTVMLYFRMAITLVVGLFTSRIVLEALGENDYGIYSVVGGIVVVLAFLNSSLSGATQRFLNYEIGKESQNMVRTVFKSSLQLHFFVALVVLILAETVGLWFLNTQMNIASDRMYAANWVYQFSVVSCLLGIITVPYNALIIAHEKMSAFAYISLIEIFLKLIIVLIVKYSYGDRLILYTFLLLLISLLIRFIYSYYCSRNFSVTRKILSAPTDYGLMKSLASFSGWSVVGSLGYISHTQGIAIIINIFFGTLVNAAEGITNQVNGIISGFVGNFLTALNPQVVKLYAANKLEEMHLLMIRGCRFSFLLVAFFAIPLMFAVPVLLDLWLTVVPEYTVIFIKLTLLITLFNSFTPLLAVAQGATGRIKYYQITLTIIGLFHLPIAWVCFYFGYPPYWAMIIYLIIIIILQICRVAFVCHSTTLSYKDFIKKVCVPCLLCITIPYVAAYTIMHVFNTGEILSATICEAVFILAVWTIGITQVERSFIKNAIATRICKR